MPHSSVTREQLLPHSTLITIAAVVSCTFFLLLPNKDRLIGHFNTRGIPQTTSDLLDFAYLKAQVAEDQDPALIIQQIKQHIKLGQLDQAQALLSNLSPHPDKQKQVIRELQFQIDIGHYHQSLAGSHQKRNMEARLVSQLITLAEMRHTRISLLLAAADLSKTLKLSGLTSTYYKRLAQSDPARAAQWWAKSAASLSQNKRYSEAAAHYRYAVEYAKNENTRITYQINQLNNLYQSGNSIALDIELETAIINARNKIPSLTRLAQLSLQLERPESAFPVYAKLARYDQQEQKKWLTLAAKWAAAANQPGKAADFLAQLATLVTPAEQASIRARQQTMLQYAGRHTEAFQLVADNIKNHPDDIHLLEQGIKLAETRADSQQASIWNQHLLTLQPDNLAAIKKQLAIELRAKHPKAAKRYAQSWVAQQPDSVTAHRKLAQISEWAADPALALAQWQWISQQSPTASSHKEIIRLAELAWKPQVAATALEWILQHSQPEPDQSHQMVSLYEKAGLPEQAEQALSRLIKQYPDQRYLWMQQAQLQNRRGHRPQALASWNQLATRFGRSSDETLARAMLQWQLRNEQAAFDIIQSYDGDLSTSATTRERQLIATLGWRYRTPRLSLDAIPGMLDQLPETDQLQWGQRLVSATLELEQPRQAIDTAQRLWYKTHNAIFLLRALELALNHASYDKADELIHQAQAQDSIRQLSSFNNLQGQLAMVRHQYDAAVRHFQSAVSAHPENLNSVESLLWAMMANNDKTALTQALTTYEPAATHQPQLWPVLAQVRLTLGQARQSLFWFEKLVQNGNPDYTTLLSYAEALERSDALPQAYRVRHYALNQLRPKVIQNLDSEHALKPALQHYLALAQRYGSPQQVDSWIQHLQAHAASDTVSQEALQDIAVSWYLTTNRSDYARYWLTTQQTQRTRHPKWQQLLLALNDKDQDTLAQLMQAPETFTLNDRVVALTALHRDQEALDVARQAVESTTTFNQRNIARQLAIPLQQQHPRQIATHLHRQNIGELEIARSGIALTHSLKDKKAGLSLALQKNTLNSDRYTLGKSSEEQDIASGITLGSQNQGIQLIAGINQREDNDLTYLKGDYHHALNNGKTQLSLKGELNTVPENTAALRASGKQNRLQLGLSTRLGKREYFSASVFGHEYKSRAGQSLATGGGTNLEAGLTGAIGSHHWQLSASASTTSNQREDQIPETLLSQLGADTRFNSILTKQSTNALLGFNIRRGDIHQDYPSMGSPRYHLDTQVGKSWPSRQLALSVQAGLGTRLLGNDELSVEAQHSQALGSTSGSEESQNQLNLQYRTYY